MLFFGYTTEKSAQKYGFFVITKTFLIFVYHKANPRLKVKDNRQMVAIAIGVIPIALEGSNGTFTSILLCRLNKRLVVD